MGTMFDYIYDWLWNFVCYMVLVTAVIQVLPENSYQKYIKFFLGLIMILLLTSPVFRLLGMEQRFQDIYQDAEYRRVMQEMERASDYVKQREQELWKEDAK